MTIQRECRYGVVKVSDVNAALTADECEQLASLMEKVEQYRMTQGKGMLECVVVESDWPVYDATWAAVQQMAASLAEG